MQPYKTEITIDERPIGVLITRIPRADFIAWRIRLKQVGAASVRTIGLQRLAIDAAAIDRLSARERAEEAEAHAFLEEAIANYVAVDTTVQALVDDDGRPVETGADLVRSYGWHAAICNQLLEAIHRENSLTVHEKNVSRARRASKSSPLAPVTAPSGATPETPAAPASSAGSAPSAPATASPEPDPSGVKVH